MSILRAKSSTTNVAPLTLVQHSHDVADAGEVLFGAAGTASRLGRQWLRFLRLDACAFDLFARTLRAATMFHDVGKANDGFDNLLDRRGKQTIYHEQFSALLMCYGPVWTWLKRHNGVDWEVALSAVLTHHLRAGIEPIRPLSVENPYVRLLVGAEFDELLDAVRFRLELSGEWPPLPQLWTFNRSGPGESLRVLGGRLTDILESLDESLDDQRRRLLWAVRAGLIIADAAASGLYRERRDMPTWINDCFENIKDCDAAFVRDEIINKRIAQLGSRWGKWQTFQKEAAVQPSRTLLLAPCGAGKTLAAWRWIEEQSRQRAAMKRAVKRIIFLYPTRATATEGFKDYVAWAPEADADLIHGTASYELEGMFTAPIEESDPRSVKSFGVDPRLFALSHWSKRVFAGTVDQFLAFLQYSYGPMCLLPVLADSIVVIDEVHSFDDKMFAALKQFLENFDLPVLCMTATLPPMRRRELEVVGLKVYGSSPPADLKAVADTPRYQIHRLRDRGAAESVAADALAARKRVLWVVNKVRVAQELARQFGVVETTDGLQTADGSPVLCYHSRFMLDDRKRWHERVVTAFRRMDDATPKAVIAITTQVCEMSLDLDADVLITEEAPITSLIQRMGRCNRKSGIPTTIGAIHVYPPADAKRPYSPDDLTGVDSFLSALDGRIVGQSNLEEELRKHGSRPPTGDPLIQFVVGGPYANSREDEFRDIDDTAFRGILDEAEYLATPLVKRPGLIVPVPRKLEERRGSERDTRFLAIAKRDHYHWAFGLCDEAIGGINHGEEI